MDKEGNMTLAEARDSINASIKKIDEATTPIELNSLLLDHIHAVAALLKTLNRYVER